MDVENVNSNNHGVKEEKNGLSDLHNEMTAKFPQFSSSTVFQAAILDPRLDEHVLLEFLRVIATKMRRAIAEPGTAIGALCAQSIGMVRCCCCCCCFCLVFLFVCLFACFCCCLLCFICPGAELILCSTLTSR
jgi:hypothetical protein